MRPWGGPRWLTLRNPKDPGWPDAGERTEDRDTAESWKWDYVSLYRGEARDRQRGVIRSKPLGKAIDEFRAHRERMGTPSTTLEAYNAPLNALLEAFGEKMPLARITAKELQRRIFDPMADEGYAPATLQKNLAAMSALLQWAKVPNVTEDVTLPVESDTEDIYTWSDADLIRLRKQADRLGMRTWFELALNTGARLNELLALRWEDFNPDAKTVRIVRQFKRRTTEPVGLKGKQARTALVLPAWWPHHTGGTGYIILRDGEPMWDRVFGIEFGRLLDAAKVNGPGRGVHDSRRTFGRLFLEAGGWMDELQRSLGHSSIRITEAHYGKFQAEVAAEFARQRIYGEGRLRLLK